MELFIVGMVLLAVLASPFVLFVLYLLVRQRLNKLERAVETLRDLHEQRLTALEENAPATAAPAEDARAHPASVAGPAPSAASARVDTESAAAGDAPPDRAVAPAEPAVAPPRASAAASAASPPSPRPARSSAEWEEIIGGNLLNKIGAVVTVIGIALGLGYSMRYLGPAGRVVLALAASAAMLATGALLEDRERYRVFARGLIGGGWAGLYFTTFAMHGVAAARIIDSPVVGTALLLAVAAGMVLHSLTYRSQDVTGLAYLITFATLAIVPTTRFALFASLPAAASLLLVARAFQWKKMMAAGVVFTYGAYVMRGGAPDVGPEDWLFGQMLLLVYWLLFETFDLLARPARQPGGIDETLMPLNAAGYVGASLLGWSAARPESLWLFFVLGAVMFAASAVLRGLLHPAAADGAEGGTAADRPRLDGPEVAVTVAAAMLVFGIEGRFSGWRESVAWLLEAQFLVLGGLLLRRRYLRHLGSAVAVLAVLAVTFNELPSSRSFIALGRQWWQSTPLALLTAATLYGNRALLRNAAGVRAAGLEHVYSAVGTFLVAAVLANELPDPWIAPAWFALGLLLAATSLRRGAGELFLQGYALVAVAWLAMVFFNVPTDSLLGSLPVRWVTAAPMIVALYALAWVRRAQAPQAPESAVRGMDALAEALDRTAPPALFAAATLLTSWFLLFEVSGSWLTVAWGLQGVALLVAGFALQARPVRLAGLALLGVCISKLFLYDAAELETVFRIFSFIILGTLLLAVSFAYGRYREQIRRLL